MVVGSKVELGDIDDLRVRNGYAIFDGAVDRRHLRQHPHSLSVADQPRELFPNMAGLVDAVLLSNQQSAAGQQIEQWQLVRNCSEAMKLDARLGQRTRKLPFPIHEDSFVWDKHVFEDRQSLHHLVAGTDGVRETALVATAV